MVRNDENDLKILKDMMDEVLVKADEIRTLCEKCGLTNEQFYLDWEDALNEISVADHVTTKINTIK